MEELVKTLRSYVKVSEIDSLVQLNKEKINLLKRGDIFYYSYAECNKYGYLHECLCIDNINGQLVYYNPQTSDMTTLKIRSINNFGERKFIKDTTKFKSTFYKQNK